VSGGLVAPRAPGPTPATRRGPRDVASAGWGSVASAEPSEASRRVASRRRRAWGLSLAALIALAAVALAAAPAQAQPQPPPPAQPLPRAARAVALAPLATMGSDDTSAVAQANAAALEKALAALPATRVISPGQMAQAIKRARKPGLAACDGELGCIAELGKLAGATVVITGQSGGLGDARVIYLRAVDTASAKEMGSTTWTTGGARSAGAGDSAAAAIARLLTPAAYTGRLLLTLTVRDATVYINGKRLGPVGKPLPPAAAPMSPGASQGPAAAPSVSAAYAVAVGTHALRVTHPEYRDFVRFVDVSYGATTEVPVTLTPLPIVQRDLAARGSAATSSAPAAAPWYGRWWAVAGGAAALAVLAGVITYSVSDGFEPDLTLP
jgi:hypothetical protein